MKPTSSKRSAFDVAPLLAAYPDKAYLLRELYHEYRNGVFLPELWRVRQLLRRHSANPPRIRSRAAAEAFLFRTLAGLERDVLVDIHDEMRLRRSGKTDLDLISDAILRRTG